VRVSSNHPGGLHRHLSFCCSGAYRLCICPLGNCSLHYMLALPHICCDRIKYLYSCLA
jgi:hypothetical protein